MSQKEAKYPVEKAKGSAVKYTDLQRENNDKNTFYLPKRVEGRSSGPLLCEIVQGKWACYDRKKGTKYMDNSEVIITIQWTNSDIVKALEKEGMDTSEENSDNIISYQNMKHLEEQSIKRGWEVIDSLVKENNKQVPNGTHLFISD